MAPVALAEVWVRNSAAESAEATITVGATFREASKRSTPCPATELMASEACEKRAASVRQSVYVCVKESAARKRSEGLKRCRVGGAAIRADIAATRFLHDVSSGLRSKFETYLLCELHDFRITSLLLPYSDDLA